MEIFFTDSEANKLIPCAQPVLSDVHFLHITRSVEVEPAIILIQTPQLWLLEGDYNGLKNFSKGLTDVKEGGIISARKWQPMQNAGTEHDEINTGGQTKWESDIWPSSGPFSIVLISCSRSFPHHTPVNWLCFVSRC